MNGDAAGSELPELTDEDVKILDTICKLAATSKEPPSKAIFASYEEVLREQGIDGRHDNVLFRWVIRLVTPRPGRPRQDVDFVRELRALLEAHGITVVDDNDTSEQRTLPNDRDANRRRVSFDDARYEETWLSNNTHTFDHDAQYVQDLSGASLHVRDAHQNKHARSLSNDRAGFKTGAQQARRYVAPEPDEVFYPSQLELDEAAEAFLDMCTLRSARRCLHTWYAAFNVYILREQSHQIIAADHDYRMLLRQAWDQVYTVYLERVSEKEVQIKERDDEARAHRFAQHNSTQRVFDYWSARTAETTAVQAPASRRLLEFRYFNRWKMLTLDTKTSTESVLLKKYFRVWSGRVSKNSQHLHSVEALYRRTMTRRAITRWKNDCRAQQHNKIVIYERTLASLQRARVAHAYIERQACTARRTTLLQAGFQSWRRHLQHLTDQSDTTAEVRSRHISHLALQRVKHNAQLITRLHEFAQSKERKLRENVLYHWLHHAGQEVKARYHNHHRLAKHALLTWNDKLRINILSQRINERLMAEMLYRLMLEERSRLCTRMRKGRLLHHGWQKLLTRSRITTASDERRIEHFTRESKRRKLAGVLQRMHMDMRRRDDAERVAIEFANAKLLPRAWTKMMQASVHMQQLAKWSHDAAFFVGTKKVIDNWRRETEHSRQEKRRLAYEHVRTRIKARLMRSTFTALRDKTAHVTILTAEAHRLRENQMTETLRQVLSLWRQHIGDHEEMQAVAGQHDAQKLCRSALAIIHTQNLHVRDMNELGEEIRADADLAMVASIFRRLRFETFTLVRLENNSDVFRERLQHRHMSRMLRHLALTANERSSRRQDQEPESPSIRPASRAASRADSRPSSAYKNTSAGQAAGTPAYLRTPSRVRRMKFRPIPTPAPFTPFSFTPAYLTTTPAPLQTVLASSSPTALEGLTPQITPFSRKLRASGIATDVRPTSILRSRPFGHSIGPGVAGTDKSVRFAGRSSRFQQSQTSSLANEIE